MIRGECQYKMIIQTQEYDGLTDWGDPFGYDYHNL